MKFRSTAILLAILAALGGAYYWFEVRGVRISEEREQREKALFDFKKDQVDKLVLARPNAQIVLSKQEGTWRVVEPLETLADSAAVDNLLGDLSAAQKQDQLESGADLAPYGLAPPQIRTEVEAGGKTYRLLFGDATPTGGYAYAMKPGAKQILLVNQTLKSAVDKQLIDVRDKTVFDLAVDQVQELRLERPSDQIVIHREGPKSWQLRAPIQTEGDPEAIRTLLTDLNNAKVKEFVDPVDSKLDGHGDYGLTKPSAKISIWVGPDRALRTLLLGRKDEEKDGVWASRDPAGPVFLVPSDLLTKVEKPVKELRDRRVLPIERNQITALEWQYADAPVQVTKLEADENDSDHWRLQQPLTTAADSTAISSLLFDLESLKAEEFPSGTPAQLGLAPPAWKLRIQQGGKALLLEVGRTAAEQPWTYVRRADGPALAVKSDELKRIQLGSFELRQKLLLDFRRDQIEKIEVTSGQQRLSVRRDGDNWQLEQPQRRKLADEELNDLIWSFDYVQMEKVFEEKPTALGDYGLEPPAAVVSVWTQGGQLVGKLKLGSAVPAAKAEPGEAWIYAYVENRSPVCAVEGSTLKSIRDALRKLVPGAG